MTTALFIAYLITGCGLYFFIVATAMGIMPGWEMDEPDASNVIEGAFGNGAIMGLVLLVLVSCTWPLVMLGGGARR